jgi:membrane-bound lytic murein transglycosylase D
MWLLSSVVTGIMKHVNDGNLLGTVAMTALLAGAILTAVHDGQESSSGMAASSAIAAGVVEAIAAPQPETEPWDLANIDHPRVDYWVERFTSDKRDEFAAFLARSGRYSGLIRERLARHGLPQDLFYLAMIESGFNPRAYSSAHASGIWQFIAGTGRRYGLEINRAVDERNDPVKSTIAAIGYLSDLHDRFGSWYLAAAAYNTGENRVGRIMRQVKGSEKGTDRDYYTIWSRLPRETRDYVPLMIAAARIGKDPERYGFGAVKPHEPYEFVEKVFAPATPLAKIARNAGTTVAEIRLLNPELKLNRTRNDEPQRIRVPAGEA